MNVYKKNNIGTLVGATSYAGRGIVVGKSRNGRQAVFAYFIMGRSENSRNRIFIEQNRDVLIKPFDASRLTDPSLIVYAPVRECGNCVVVTNGDQTETICRALSKGQTFEQALETRRFEPDSPHFTPRISAILTFAGGGFTYKMSILKSADAEGSACNRFTFSYEPTAGVGHFIHTYAGDGNPLPTFTGEPRRVSIPSDIDVFTSNLWERLDEDNRISLYTRSVDLATGMTQARLINKYGRAEK